MFILRALGPPHYSRGDWVTIRIHELPITRELRRGHPFWQRFGLVFVGRAVRQNYGDDLVRGVLKDSGQLCFQIQLFIKHGGTRLVQPMCHEQS